MGNGITITSVSLYLAVVEGGAIPIAIMLHPLKSSLHSLSGFLPCFAHPMYPHMHVTVMNVGIIIYVPIKYISVTFDVIILWLYANLSLILNKNGAYKNKVT